MNRILTILIVALISCLLPEASHAGFAMPDFAFPATVSDNARAQLARADALQPDSASIVRLRALLELTVATAEVEPDSVYAMPAMIAAQGAKADNSDPGRAMLMALEASVLTRIYESNSWRIDRIDVAAGDAPSDIRLWGKANFVATVTALTDEALAVADIGDVPLESFADVVTGSSAAISYVSSVGDFIRTVAVNASMTFGLDDRTEELIASALENSENDSARHIYWLYMRDRTNPQALRADYRANKNVEAARLLLMGLLDENRVSAVETESVDDETAGHLQYFQSILALVREIEDSLEQFPDWVDNDLLRNQYAYFTAPTVSIETPNFAAPGHEVSVQCFFWYADTVAVDIYRLPQSTREFEGDFAGLGAPQARLSMIPTHVYGTADLPFTFEECGSYVLVPVLNGVTGTGYNLLTVAPFIPVNLSAGNENALITADFTTGAPVRNVTVDMNLSSFRTSEDVTVRLGRTDRHGIVRYTTEERRGYSRWLSFTKDRHTFDFNRSITPWHVNPGRAEEYCSIVFVTDRALYHQGDTVRFAAVATRRTQARGTVAAGTEVTVSLLDANRQQVDNVTLTTDELGRIDGSFVIPQGRLTGSYSLRGTVDQRQAGSATLTVSDFKLPVIYVENTAIEPDAPAQGAVTLRGIVKTYSGMPVGGARIDIAVKSALRWWCWFRPMQQIGTVSGTTAADGTYAIEIPADILTAGLGKYFVADITATNANAETANTTCNISTGKKLALEARNLGNIDGSKAATATVSAFNPQGENEAIELTWELGIAANDTAMASTVLRGTAIAGSPIELDLTGVAAGTYALKATPADITLANPLLITNFVTVYNTATNDVPASGKPYFLPSGECKRDGRRASLLIGTALDEATVYITVGMAERLASVGAYKLRRGFTTLSIDVPASTDDIAPVLNIVAVRDGDCQSDRVTVKEPEPVVLEIKAESFRDRLTPGTTETLRFRIVYAKSGAMRAGASGAGMIATMYNGALNALKDYSMASGFGLRRPLSSVNVLKPFLMHNSASMAITPDLHFDQTEWEWPSWLFLDNLQLNARGTIYMRGYKAMMSNANIMADTAMPVSSEATMESADAEEYETAAGDAGNNTEEDAYAEPEVQYRSGEVLQAFFMPRLVSDAEGNVDIVFTVPNANGSWDFRAFAWSGNLASATFGATAVASKPVMAQPNLPRFLRQGDSAMLGATVYNNTDSTAIVNTTVELFSTATGEVLESFAFADTIASLGNAVVTVPATAPTDRAAIGYRIRSSNGRYTDGEQTAIPVLSSDAPVIESTEFYLNATQEPLELHIPVHEGTVYTLEYVSNPVWTVVKAMRGLDGIRGTAAPTLASAIYSALAARKIASDCAGVAEAFESWQANPEQQALVSMLARNEQLKMLMLNQTPWVQASQNETDRMAQLGRIFDSAAVEASIAAKTESLERLQGRDGGFAWLSGFNESSEWATRSVLISLGLANSMGMLEDEPQLKEMCRSAFSYICAELTRSGRTTRTDFEFARICSLWPDFEPAPAARAILDATITDIARNWRSMSLPAKASAVCILKQAGRQTEAAAILTSIRQFGVVRDGQGLCFPSVNDIRAYATIIRAFAMMDEPRPTLDAMRQWITVRAQATDDLGAANPDYVIASMLLTGTDWTAAPRAYGVSVDSRPLEVSQQAMATGYTTAQLQPSGNSLNIRITPNGATPSYGAVVAIGNRPQATVAARPGRDISIEKRFLVNRGNRWIATDTFALGERVRVQLIMQVNRAMEYVTITDRRAATLEPVEQMPGYVQAGTLALYRENGDADTNLFINYLPAGTYHVTYDMTANNEGRFISGIATVQSQYAPELTAHSAGGYITVE